MKALTASEPDNLTRTAQTPPPSLFVQAGAYSDRHNAERVLERLRKGGLGNALIVAPPEPSDLS